MTKMVRVFAARNWVTPVEWPFAGGSDEEHLESRIEQLEELLGELWKVTDEYHRLLRYHMLRRKSDKKYAELAARVRATVKAKEIPAPSVPEIAGSSLRSHPGNLERSRVGKPRTELR